LRSLDGKAAYATLILDRRGFKPLGICLGIEGYNTPKPDSTFAEKIAMLRDVHFALDRSDLNPDSTELLTADAEILKAAFKQFGKATVIVEGYCDERGAEEYNFTLGYKRAEAARQACWTHKSTGRNYP
jgi:peptidoglycan-associated lipoprotein